MAYRQQEYIPVVSCCLYAISCCNAVLFEKLLVSQLVKRFRGPLPRVCHSTPSNSVGFISVLMLACSQILSKSLNLLTPNEIYSGRTASLTSKHCILYIYSTHTGTEYFKHGIHSPFLSLQNAVCFIILIYLVPVLFTFYIQSVLNVAFYIFIQQIQVLNILNTVYTLRFFPFKMHFVS